MTKREIERVIRMFLGEIDDITKARILKEIREAAAQSVTR